MWGGFPGIPLAIMFPDSKFHLVDSIGKKIKVVTEVAAGIGLTNLTAQHERAEKINDKYHFTVSRAVTAFPEFYNWINKKILKENFNDLPNGILYLKGGDLREEFGHHYDKAVFYDLKTISKRSFLKRRRSCIINYNSYLRVTLKYLGMKKIFYFLCILSFLQVRSQSWCTVGSTWYYAIATTRRWLCKIYLFV